MHICLVNLPSLVQIMAWHLAGTKPLSEPMLNIVNWTLGNGLSEILIKIYTFSLKKMHLKMSSGKWQPFRLSLNELKGGQPEFNRQVARWAIRFFKMLLCLAFAYASFLPHAVYLLWCGVIWPLLCPCTVINPILLTYVPWWSFCNLLMIFIMHMF